MYRMHSLKFLQRDKITGKLNSVIKTVPLNNHEYLLHSKRQSTNFILIDMKCL